MNRSVWRWSNVSISTGITKVTGVGFEYVAELKQFAGTCAFGAILADVEGLFRGGSRIFLRGGGGAKGRGVNYSIGSVIEKFRSSLIGKIKRIHWD